MTSKEIILKRIEMAKLSLKCDNSPVLKELDKKEIEEMEQLLQDLERLEQLEQENQDLKDKLNSEALDNWQLHCKYGKYKKAIEFFKDNFEVCEDNGTYKLYFSNCMIRVSICEIVKEEYELLKEVLKNE